MRDAHKQDLPEAKDVIICHIGAIVGFVEEESNAADNEQHAQVLGQWVLLPQQRHSKEHHYRDNNTTGEVQLKVPGREFRQQL